MGRFLRLRGKNKAGLPDIKARGLFCLITPNIIRALWARRYV